MPQKLLKHLKPLFTGNLCSWLLGKHKSLNPSFSLFSSALFGFSYAFLVSLFLKSSRYQRAFKNCVIFLFIICITQQRFISFATYFVIKNRLYNDEEGNPLCMSVCWGMVGTHGWMLLSVCYLLFIRAQPFTKLSAEQRRHRVTGISEQTLGCARAPEWVMMCDRHPAW